MNIEEAIRGILTFLALVPFPACDDPCAVDGTMEKQLLDLEQPCNLSQGVVTLAAVSDLLMSLSSIHLCFVPLDIENAMIAVDLQPQPDFEGEIPSATCTEGVCGRTASSEALTIPSLAAEIVVREGRETILDATSCEFSYDTERLGFCVVQGCEGPRQACTEMCLIAVLDSTGQILPERSDFYLYRGEDEPTVYAVVSCPSE